MRKMKDSGIEWIGMIPEGWKLLKAKYLFAQRNEKGNALELQLLSPTQKYGVVPQKLYEELSGMKAVKLDENTDYNQMKSIYCGDFCISLRSFQGGFEYSIYNGVVSPAYQVFHKTQNIHNEYYRYLFKEHGFIGQMASLTKTFRDGKSISYEDFSNSLIPVPPLPEQRRIAAYLDATCAQIDAVIEKTCASIEEYKKLKQAVITQAVTKGIRPGRKMKDSGIEWIGEIPEEWEVTKVKHVSLVVTDGAHVSPETENGVYDFVSTVNIENEHINFDNCLKTSESSYRYLVSTGCKPQIGDVLISKDGTVGKTVVVTEERDFVIASSLVIIRPNKSIISTKYLNYSLQSKNIQDKLILLMHGAGLKRVSVAKNANLNILLPELKEQTQIVAYLDAKCTEIDTLIAKKQQLLAELESYKKSLIFEYVTGKKEVAES